MESVSVQLLRQDSKKPEVLRPRKKRAPRPADCRTYTRAKVAEALPEIVDRLVEEAKQGSIAHVKLLASLGGLNRAEMPMERKRAGRSMVALLMERLSEMPEDTAGSEIR
jgi:hypothetical protein